MRPFSPSFSLRATQGLSKALQIWVLQIFKDYDIQKEYLTGAVTDKGSDIIGLSKKKVIGDFWEWCVPHLLKNAVQAAFGLNVRKGTEGPNPDVAQLVSNIIKTVYLTKNKTSLGRLWLELGGGDGKLLKNFQEQRFLGVYDVMRRVLDLWEQIELFFDIARQSEPDLDFPIEHSREQIYELVCLLHPLVQISKLAQRKEEVCGFKVLKRMHDLKLGIMDPKNTLYDIHEPKSIEIQKEGTKLARNLLISAISNE